MRLNRMLEVLSGAPAGGRVPIWELHFHLWGKLGYGDFVSGERFARLTAVEQQSALERDADIIVRAAQELGMDAVTIPDSPWDCVYTLPLEARLALTRLVRARDRTLCLIAGVGATIAMPGDSRSFMELCYLLMDDPDEVGRRADAIHSKSLALLRQFAEAGLDVVYTPTDMADNRGLFFSPGQLDRYVWPHLQSWVEEAHALSLRAILHTDGNVQAALPRIVQCGFDGLQALDPIAGMSLPGARAAVGDRLALCGNIDCSLMLAGTPEAVYHSVVKLLDADGKNRMALGCSNAVVINTPIENYHALLKAHRDWTQKRIS